MKKLLIILSLLLHGCTDSNKNEEQDQNAFLELASFSENIAFMYSNYIEKNYIEEPTKIEPYFLKSDSIKKNLETFSSFLEQEMKDSLAIPNFELCLAKYQQANELLENLSPLDCRKSLSDIKGFTNFDENSINSLLKMKISLSIKTANVMRCVYAGVEFGCKWTAIIETKEENNSDNEYRFIVKSNNYNRNYFAHTRITIDTIIKDNKLTNLKPLVTSGNLIGTVSFKDLANGNYIVIGKARYISEDGLGVEKPFEHKFKKE